MSVDCLSLQTMNPTNITIDETNTTVIWLDEDFTVCFSVTSWTSSFLIGLIFMILFALLHSYWFACIHLFSYDKSQKLIKLKLMDLDEPILKKDVKNTLTLYLNHNQDIIDIIFEFTGINSNTLMEYLDSIMTSNIDSISLNMQFKYSLLVWILFIITYILLFHATIHLTDSYYSFIEVPYVMAYEDACLTLREGTDGDDDWDRCVYTFDLNNICKNDTLNATYINNIEYYGNVYMIHNDAYNNYSRKMDCVIDKNTFKYRAMYIGDDGCCECKCCCKCWNWFRICNCGRCCDYCYVNCIACRSCDLNCCCLLACILNGLWMIVAGCTYFVTSESNMRNEYKVEMIEAYLLDDLLLGSNKKTDKEMIEMQINVKNSYSI
eukprot:468689_1